MSDRAMLTGQSQSESIQMTDNYEEQMALDWGKTRILVDF